MKNSGTPMAGIAAPRPTRDAHVARSRITIACGAGHPRLHRRGRTDHSPTDSLRRSAADARRRRRPRKRDRGGPRAGPVARSSSAGVAGHRARAAGIAAELRIGEEPFTTLVPADLGVSSERQEAASQQAFAALMRPLLIAHLLDAGAESVLLLPSDAQVYAPLTAFAGDHDVLLVPRLLGALPDDGARPDGHDLAEAGEIDDELVAVRATETGRAFVDWWAEAAGDAARGRPARRARRAIFPGIGRVEDPRLRRLLLEPARANASARADALGGLPTGPAVVAVPTRDANARARRPDAHRARRRARRGAARRRLDSPRRAGHRRRRAAQRPALRCAAAALLPRPPTRARTSATSCPPADRRRVHRLAARARAGGGARGINRYAYDVWHERNDVQEAYPDLDGGDADGFIGWLWVHGRDGAGAPGAASAGAAGVGRHGRARVPPVLVAGYLRGNLGLGEAARALRARARSRAGVPLATRRSGRPAGRRLPRGAPPAPEGARVRGIALPEAVPEINHLCVNADQTPELSRRSARLRRRYTIGLWAWETDTIPERWDRAFTLVDEIWVYSTYVAENIARAAACRSSSCRCRWRPRARGRDVPFEVPDGFVFLFVVRLLLDAGAQEPGRPGRGVQAGVRARRGPDAGAEDDQRATSARRSASGCATRSVTARTSAWSTGRSRRASWPPCSPGRLLRLVASRRGLRADAGGVDGAGQASDRHGVLRQHRLHDARQLLPGRLDADRGRPGRRALPGRGHWAEPSSSTPPR